MLSEYTATTEEADVIKEATRTEEERVWYDYDSDIKEPAPAKETDPKKTHKDTEPAKDLVDVYDFVLFFFWFLFCWFVLFFKFECCELFFLFM